MRDGRSSRGLRDPCIASRPCSASTLRRFRIFSCVTLGWGEVTGNGLVTRMNQGKSSVWCSYVVSMMVVALISSLMMLTRNISGGSLGSRGSFALHVDGHGGITMIWKRLSVRRAFQLGEGTSLVCMWW